MENNTTAKKFDKKNFIKYVPNILTISRLVLTLIIVLLLTINWDKGTINYVNNSYLIIFSSVFAAGIIFAIASLTDFLDGFIARKYNLVSNFGKFWDPIADKILVDATLIALTGILIVPAWITILMIFRDLVVDGGRMVCSSKGKVIPANIFGKIKTIAQMIAIILIMCLFNFKTDALGTPYVNWIGNAFLLIALAFSLISGGIYIYQMFFKKDGSSSSKTSEQKIDIVKEK